MFFLRASTGAVDAGVNYAAGCVGHVDTGAGSDNVSIKRCVNSGAVSGTMAIGGIVGGTDYSSGTVNIDANTNLGAVTGSATRDEIVGYENVSTSTLTNNYFDGVLCSGCANDDSAVTAATATFHLKSNPPFNGNGYDFVGVWKENSGSLPTLL